MPNNNGIITAPIGIGSVQQVLGSSAHDAKSLCTNDNINKNSVFKPIEYANHVAPLTMDERKEKNFGYNLTSYSSAQTAWNALIGGNAFPYQKPITIGRLSDFINYQSVEYDQTNGIPPYWFETRVAGGGTVTIGGNTAISIWGHRIYEENNNLGALVRDLFNWGFFSTHQMSNFYFGFLFAKGSTNGSLYFLPYTDNTHTINDLGESLSFSPTSPFSDDTWYAYPAFTPLDGSYSYLVPSLVTNSNSSWYLFPLASIAVFTISSSGGGSSYEVSGSLTSAGNNTLTYNGNNSYTLSDVVLELINGYPTSKFVGVVKLDIFANNNKIATNQSVVPSSQTISGGSNKNLFDFADITFTSTNEPDIIIATFFVDSNTAANTKTVSAPIGIS